jgi:hypothetical protein
MPVRLSSWDVQYGLHPIFEMNLPEGVPSADFESIFRPKAPLCTVSHSPEQTFYHQSVELHAARNRTKTRQIPVQTGTRTGTKKPLKYAGFVKFPGGLLIRRVSC